MRKFLLALIILVMTVSAAGADNTPPTDPPALNIGARTGVGDKEAEALAAMDIDELTQKAEGGDAVAMVDLARYYCNNANRKNRADHNQLTYTWLLRAAELGNVDAMFMLGGFCDSFSSNNLDVSCVKREAYDWYLKAAEKGHFMAQRQLVQYYSMGRLTVPDYTRALYWAMQSYDNNDFNAWRNLSWLSNSTAKYLQNDTEAEQQWQEARQRTWTPVMLFVMNQEFEFDEGVLSAAEFLAWVEKKAKDGDAVGMALLARMYFLGMMVEQDYVQAYAWSAKAEAQGVRFSLSIKHDFLEDGQPKIDIKAQTELALAGDHDAAFLLGHVYYWGGWVRQDVAKSLGWYREAAQTLTDAKLELGRIYGDFYDNFGPLINPRPFYERIVPRDYAEAAKWYLAAAEDGNMFAQYELADLYARGLGVPRDYRQALLWFEKAAAQEAELGVEERMETLFLIREPGDIAYRMGLIYADAQGNVLDYAAARKWFLNAAVQGHYGALYELGQMYENGWGVPQSYHRAARFYYKAIGGANYFGSVTDARAYLALADLSSCGKTIYGNNITAVWLYKKVDDLPDAQYALANACLYGDGTRQSPAKA